MLHGIVVSLRIRNRLLNFYLRPSAVFPDSATLAKAISMEGTGGSLTLGIGDLILVKGSRGLKMERACEAIESLEYLPDTAFQS